LDMQDPSSMKRSLSAVRNARGVAASVGMDERHALGMLAQANDTAVAMGMDRNIAAAFNNANFAGAMVQGAQNMSRGGGPFDDEVFRRQQSAEDMMKDRAKMTTFMLQEAEADPTGTLSRSIMLEAFMAKNPKAMEQTIKEGPNKGKTLGEVITDGLQDQSADRDETIANLVSTVQDVTGTDLDERAYTVGLQEEMKQLDRETLDKIATTTMRAEELSRNQERVAEHYLPMQIDMARAANAITDSNLTEDEQAERLEGLAALRDMATTANEIGGLENLALMSGIAEGRSGKFIHQNKAMDASEMDEAQRRDVIIAKLMDTGKFESQEEAEAQADKFISGVKALQNMEEETGVFAKSASEAFAAMKVDTSQDFSLSAFNTSDQAIRAGAEAAEIGGKRFMGDVAATDPLQNFIYGMLGEDARNRRQSALERVKQQDGVTVTDVDADALGLTMQQRELYAKMQNPDMDKEAAGESQAVQNALTDFQQRTMAELEGTTITGADGEETTLLAQIAKQAGVSEEDLQSFKQAGTRRAELEQEEQELRKQLASEKDAETRDEEAIKDLENQLSENQAEQAEVTSSQLDTFANLTNPLGAADGGRASFIDDLEQQLGIVTTFRKKSKEEMQEELDSLAEKKIEQEKAVEEASTPEEKAAAEDALARTEAEMLRLDSKGGEEGGGDGKVDDDVEDFALELVQKDGTFIDDDENTETAMEAVKRRENFERGLSATKARSFLALKENMRVAEEREEVDLQRQRFQELSDKENLSEEEQEELNTLREDDLVTKETVTDEDLAERASKEDSARFEELSAMDPEDLSTSEKKELDQLTEDREINKFLKEGDETSDAVSPGSISSARKDFIRDAIGDDDFRESLQTDEGIQEAMDMGISASEIRDSLSAADRDLREQQQGLDTEGDEFRRLQDQREEIRSAKEQLAGHYGEGDGGMLAELVDVLSRAFDGGKPIPVVMQN